jgi:hypothetical protein
MVGCFYRGLLCFAQYIEIWKSPINASYSSLMHLYLYTLIIMPAVLNAALVKIVHCMLIASFGVLGSSKRR